MARCTCNARVGSDSIAEYYFTRGASMMRLVTTNALCRASLEDLAASVQLPHLPPMPLLTTGGTPPCVRLLPHPPHLLEPATVDGQRRLLFPENELTAGHQLDGLLEGHVQYELVRTRITRITHRIAH